MKQWLPKTSFTKIRQSKNPQKIARGKKNNLMGERSIVLPGVVRIYITYNDATDSSSDEEENL
ncbi:hypothetical protein KY290_021451 [Solanum tuberosum]|uniref:Uncharacterized protein n=1 Tax=Solanum tuberosum TaxID=4113 RepID=A0ABQ7V3N3_SOLTU|nr:hypothetical protein KY289_020601 [Solanum tuberosum]KAH0693259.1 hypothetical protein KY285_020356 [Solanum tuberosum]KAH0757958.1 hypothetical protein KY290_021451 [Solanum tuberosum]